MSEVKTRQLTERCYTCAGEGSIQRPCCDLRRDLWRVEDDARNWDIGPRHYISVMRCKECGQLWRLESEHTAAGSSVDLEALDG